MSLCSWVAQLFSDRGCYHRVDQTYLLTNERALGKVEKNFYRLCPKTEGGGGKGVKSLSAIVGGHPSLPWFLSAVFEADLTWHVGTDWLMVTELNNHQKSQVPGMLHKKSLNYGSNFFQSIISSNYG